MLKKVLRRDPERQYVITEYNDKKEQVRGYSQIRVKHEPVMALQDSS